MNKDCVRRGDIWMANLISGKGDVLQGSHPVIIVSNNRNNRRYGWEVIENNKTLDDAVSKVYQKLLEEPSV